MRAASLARLGAGFIYILWSLQFLYAFNPSPTYPTTIHLSRRSLSSTVDQAKNVGEHCLCPSLAGKSDGAAPGKRKITFDLNLIPDEVTDEECSAATTNVADSADVADELPRRPPGTPPQGLHSQLVAHDYLGNGDPAILAHTNRDHTHEFLPSQNGVMRKEFKDAYSPVDPTKYLPLGDFAPSARFPENVHSVHRPCGNIQAAMELQSLLAPMTLDAPATHRRVQVPALVPKTSLAHQALGHVSTIPWCHVPAGDTRGQITPEVRSPPSDMIMSASSLKPAVRKALDPQMGSNDQRIPATPGTVNMDLQAIPRTESYPSSNQHTVGWKDAQKKLHSDPVASNVDMAANPLSFCHTLCQARPSQSAEGLAGGMAVMKTDFTGPPKQPSAEARTVIPFEEMWEKAYASTSKDTVASESALKPGSASEPRINSEGDGLKEAEGGLRSSNRKPSISNSPPAREAIIPSDYHNQKDQRASPLVEHVHQDPATGLRRPAKGKGFRSTRVASAQRETHANKSKCTGSTEWASDARETSESASMNAAVRFLSDSETQAHKIGCPPKSSDLQPEGSSSETNELGTSDDDYSGAEEALISERSLSEPPVKSKVNTLKTVSVVKTSDKAYLGTGKVPLSKVSLSNVLLKGKSKTHETMSVAKAIDGNHSGAGNVPISRRVLSKNKDKTHKTIPMAMTNSRPIHTIKKVARHPNISDLQASDALPIRKRNQPTSKGKGGAENVVGRKRNHKDITGQLELKSREQAKEAKDQIPLEELYKKNGIKYFHQWEDFHVPWFNPHLN